MGDCDDAAVRTRRAGQVLRSRMRTRTCSTAPTSIAMKAHGTQMRASGDPYFSHPVEVAGILAEMKLDSASIVTGLLHDTVEDTDATLDEIERHVRRGDRPPGRRRHQAVAHRSCSPTSTKQAENFRKLVLAMSEDIRVLLVKLADRLHNMRTLHLHQGPGEAPAHRARDDGHLRAARRAHRHAADEATSSRTSPSPSSIPMRRDVDQRRAWATCASKGGEIVPQDRRRADARR